MSRRHGRAHHHERPRHEGPKPGTPQESRGVRAPEAGPAPAPTHAAKNDASPAHLTAPAPIAATVQAPVTPAPQAPRLPDPPIAEAAAVRPAPDGATNGAPLPHANGMDRIGPACTAPQLRRFIKSRPYVPMHELRRRFAIEGGDDDVSPVEMSPGRIYVGLPAREGQLLGELLRAGEIGFELSLDPRTPIVVGVYPMRPVPRP